jgi:hypothetical protein
MSNFFSTEDDWSQRERVLLDGFIDFVGKLFSWGTNAFQFASGNCVLTTRTGALFFNCFLIWSMT